MNKGAEQLFSIRRRVVRHALLDLLDHAMLMRALWILQEDLENGVEYSIFHYVDRLQHVLNLGEIKRDIRRRLSRCTVLNESDLGPDPWQEMLSFRQTPHPMTQTAPRGTQAVLNTKPSSGYGHAQTRTHDQGTRTYAPQDTEATRMINDNDIPVLLSHDDISINQMHSHLSTRESAEDYIRETSDILAERFDSKPLREPAGIHAIEADPEPMNLSVNMELGLDEELHILQQTAVPGNDHTTRPHPQHKPDSGTFVFNYVLRTLLTRIQNKSRGGKGNYSVTSLHKHLLNEVSEMGLNEKAFIQFTEWCHGRSNAVLIGSDDLQHMRAILHAMYIWMCHAYGPTEADSIYGEIFAKANNLPQSNDFPADDLL